MHYKVDVSRTGGSAFLSGGKQAGGRISFLFFFPTGKAHADRVAGCDSVSVVDVVFRLLSPLRSPPPESKSTCFRQVDRR